MRQEPTVRQKPAVHALHSNQQPSPHQAAAQHARAVGSQQQHRGGGHACADASEESVGRFGAQPGGSEGWGGGRAWCLIANGSAVPQLLGGWLANSRAQALYSRMSPAALLAPLLPTCAAPRQKTSLQVLLLLLDCLTPATLTNSAYRTAHHMPFACCSTNS